MESIRHRTRTGRYKPTHAPDVAWTREGEPIESAPIEDPPARFLEELGALGGHGRRVENLEEARDYVLALARERGAQRLIRWDVEELDGLGVDEPLREAGGEEVPWQGLHGVCRGGGEKVNQPSDAGCGHPHPQAQWLP